MVHRTRERTTKARVNGSECPNSRTLSPLPMVCWETASLLLFVFKSLVGPFVLSALRVIKERWKTAPARNRSYFLPRGYVLHAHAWSVRTNTLRTRLSACCLYSDDLCLCRGGWSTVLASPCFTRIASEQGGHSASASTEVALATLRQITATQCRFLSTAST